MIPVALVLALAAVAPERGEAQVHPVTDLPPGPVVFVAPGGALVISPGQVSAERATLAVGDTVQVLAPGTWRLGLEWFDPVSRESRGVGSVPRSMRVGDELALCAVVVTGEADTEVAVSEGCGCVYPDAIELWPGAVEFESADPSVVTVDPSTMCAGGGP